MAVLNRRQIVSGAAGAVGLGLGGLLPGSSQRRAAAARQAEPATSIRWATNEAYSRPSMLDPFTEETGIAVEVEVFSDVREIFNKLVVGGTGIHALTDGSYHSRFFLEEDLLQPVDLSNIPNWENIIAAFKDADGISKDGQTYGVPFIFGTDSVAYRGDQIEGPVDSLDILWDPQYAGKIAMPGGLLESIFVAAMRLGFDNPFDLSDEQLEEVKQSLLEQKPLLRTYWVEIGDLKNLFATGEVAVAFSWVPVLELNKDGIDVRWALPKEGQLGWYDANFVTKEASPEQKLAVEQLMNWTLGDQYGKTLAEEVAYRTTSQLAIEQMSPEQVEELSLGDPEAFLAGTVWWVPEARSDAYEKVWDEVLNS